MSSISGITTTRSQSPFFDIRLEFFGVNDSLPRACTFEDSPPGDLAKVRVELVVALGNWLDYQPVFGAPAATTTSERFLDARCNASARSLPGSMWIVLVADIALLLDAV